MKVYQLHLIADHASTPGAIVQEIDPRLFKSSDDAVMEVRVLNDVVFDNYEFEDSEAEDAIKDGTMTYDEARDNYDTSGSYRGYDCSSLPFWTEVEIDTDTAI